MEESSGTALAMYSSESEAQAGAAECASEARDFEEEASSRGVIVSRMADDEGSIIFGASLPPYTDEELEYLGMEDGEQPDGVTSPFETFRVVRMEEGAPTSFLGSVTFFKYDGSWMHG